MMGSQERVRVLICDDDEAFRQALRLLLESDKQIEVIGDATNGEEAVKLTRRPFPRANGMEVRECRRWSLGGDGFHANRSSLR